MRKTPKANATSVPVHYRPAENRHSAIIIRHFLTVIHQFWDWKLRKPHHQIRRVTAICRAS